MKIVTPGKIEIDFNDNAKDWKESFTVAMLARLLPHVAPNKVLRLVDGIFYWPELVTLILLVIFFIVDVPVYLSVIATLLLYTAANIMNLRCIVVAPLPQIAAFFRPRYKDIRVLVFAIIMVLGHLVFEYSRLVHLIVLIMVIMAEEVNYQLNRVFSRVRESRMGLDMMPNEVMFIVAYLYYARKYEVTTDLRIRRSEFDTKRYRDCLDYLDITCRVKKE